MTSGGGAGGGGAGSRASAGASTSRPPAPRLALQRLLFVSAPSSLFSDLCLSSFFYLDHKTAGGGSGSGSRAETGSRAGTGGIAVRSADMRGGDLEGLEGGNTMTLLAVDRANNCVTRLNVCVQTTSCALQSSGATASRLPMTMTGAVSVPNLVSHTIDTHTLVTIDSPY